MTNTPLVWLPDLIKVDAGSWAEDLKQLYAVFRSDFVTGGPRYKGLPVWHDRRKLDRVYEEGFWHLVTQDYGKTKDRSPDLHRARRLRWCRATIDNSEPPDVLVFDYEEGNGKTRRYLWVHECDYLVILEKRSKDGEDRAYLLVTAFSFENDTSYRKTTQRKYDQRVS
jgi:hypothetical protein